MPYKTQDTRNVELNDGNIVYLSTLHLLIEISRTGESTISDLCRVTGLQPEAARRRLEALAKNKYIIATKNPRYNDAGKKVGGFEWRFKCTKKSVELLLDYRQKLDAGLRRRTLHNDAVKSQPVFGKR